MPTSDEISQRYRLARAVRATEVAADLRISLDALDLLFQLEMELRNGVVPEPDVLLGRVQRIVGSSE